MFGPKDGFITEFPETFDFENFMTGRSRNQKVFSAILPKMPNVVTTKPISQKSWFNSSTFTCFGG